MKADNSPQDAKIQTGKSLERFGCRAGTERADDGADPIVCRQLRVAGLQCLVEQNSTQCTVFRRSGCECNMANLN